MNRFFVAFAFVFTFLLQGCGCFQTQPQEPAPAVQPAPPQQVVYVPVGPDWRPGNLPNGGDLTAGERINNAVADRVVARTNRASNIEVAAGESLATAVRTEGANLTGRGMDSIITFASQGQDVVDAYEGRAYAAPQVVDQAAQGPRQTRTPTPTAPRPAQATDTPAAPTPPQGGPAPAPAPGN